MNIRADLLVTARGRGPRTLMTEILEYLRIFATGCNYPVTEAQIDRDLELKKTVARQIIRKLRIKGNPIASSKNGYWVLPPMPSEIDVVKYEDYLKNLENRAIKIFEVRKSQIFAYNKVSGKQLKLRKV